MPMTGITPEQNQRIEDFKNRLMDLGKKIVKMDIPIIDPRNIDMETGADLSYKVERAIRRHTNHKDLNWYIGRDASDLVAIYPEGTAISKGVSDETIRGLESGKNTFVIYPKPHSNTSPFMDRAKKVFENETEFFEYYEKYLPQRLKELERS
jgi:hypothetical protein